MSDRWGDRDPKEGIGLVFESRGRSRRDPGYHPRYKVIDGYWSGNTPMFLLERVDNNSRTEPTGTQKRMTSRVFQGFGAYGPKYRQVSE